MSAIRLVNVDICENGEWLTAVREINVSKQMMAAVRLVNVYICESNE